MLLLVRLLASGVATTTATHSFAQNCAASQPCSSSGSRGQGLPESTERQNEVIVLRTIMVKSSRDNSCTTAKTVIYLP